MTLHLTGPALRFSEPLRALQPARQVNAIVRRPRKAHPMDHAEIMNSCDAKGHRVGLEKLTRTERIVTLLSIANFEIENGGFSQYFYNSVSEHATQALAALQEVGAMRAAAALQAALALFPPGKTTGPDEHFCEVLSQASERLNELTSEFYAEQPDVFCRLCTYIESHASELKEHGA